VLRLRSDDGINRLTTACVLELTSTLEAVAGQMRALIITGNQNFFSAGADLHEIAALSGPSGLEFSQMGQRLMNSIECFPAPVYAAISGYCMGGGLDLALACHRRRSRLDYGLGRNTTASAAGGERNSTPNVCGGGENHSKSWVANWIDRHGRGRSSAMCAHELAALIH